MFGWFGKKAQVRAPMDLSGVADEKDRKILETLARFGDPLSPPRHTMYYFYRFETDLRPAGEVFAPIAAEAAGLGLRINKQDNDTLILECEQSMVPEMVNAARRLMDGWALSYDVVFDGWQAAACVPGRSRTGR